MILDALDLPDQRTLTADICIVGAGAAGIAMALELIGCGMEVLLLESGGFDEDPPTQALYSGSVADAHLHSPPDRYRQRRFGGSTTIWGGRCMPMDDIDFEVRNYLPQSGWPLHRDALEPFYRRANQVCEAGDFAYTAAAAFRKPLRPMIDQFRSRHFTTDTLERFSCPTDFSVRYLHKLRSAPNIRVVLHANLTRISLNAGGTGVTSIQLKTLSGKTLPVQARNYVLAMGGLEIPRVLLANRDVQRNGIGNDHDLVGRYYMCHVAGTIGKLQLNLPRDSVWHGYNVSDEGIYCRRRLALTAETQRRHGIGNFIARLHHPRITDPAHRTGMLSLLYLAKAFIPYEYGKRLHGEEHADFRTWLMHVRNVLGDPGYTASFLWHWLRYRTLAERKFPSIIIQPKAHIYSLDFHSEQQPAFESRVTLAAEHDALGMPRVHVDWRYSEWDIHTVRTALDLFARDVLDSGIGTFSYDSAHLEQEVMRYGAYGGHHLGTARMGDDPRTSVVDANCRVHGVHNLFIASSATFPTSSQANPTLTIIALALRIADHLKPHAMRAAPDLRAAENQAPADRVAWPVAAFVAART
jgi:choline dehydrogenase-like flavoprotein